MKNFYEIRGDTTAIFLESPKYGRMETLVATTDLARAQEFPGRWRALWCKGTRSYYVRGSMQIEYGVTKQVSLHRWLLVPSGEKGLSVDHILHDTLDNCRWALNVGTHQENMQNKRRYRNNYSGYPGVTWHKRSNKWMVTVQRDGKTCFIGYFHDREEAIKARKYAETEFQKQNEESADLCHCSQNAG